MFKKYEYVYQVYKTGSFTKAAEKLYISQPSLSAAIKKIEDEIGAPLFVRSGAGGVALTEIGREYINSAEKIMNVQKDFLNRLNDIFSLETGSITVGGTNYLSSYVLPKIINRFAVKYPKISVTLVEANSISLSHMLENETVDVIIDSFDSTMDIYDGFPLKKEKILLCVPMDREINKKFSENCILPSEIFNGRDIDSVEPVFIKDFKNEPFILLKNGNDMYFRAKKILDEAKVQPNVVFSVDQMNISYALSASGMGDCFLTDTLFKYGNFPDNVCLYNVNYNFNARTLYVAHKKNKYVSRAMEEFINIAKEQIK